MYNKNSMVYHFQQIECQPGEVVNPAHSPLFPFAGLASIRTFSTVPVRGSRETGSTIPSRVSSPILHTQAESGAYSRAPLIPSALHQNVVNSIDSISSSIDSIDSID